MLFYCIILILLIILFITTFHYKKEEYICLPHKEHPLSFLYGPSLYILDFINKHLLKEKASKGDKKLMDKLSRLYIGIKPEKLLRLYKAKSISISFLLVFIFSALGMIFSLTNNTENNALTSIDRPTDGSSIETYEITAIIDGESTDIVLEIESPSYSLEDAIAYFDTHRDNIEAALLDRNTNSYEITNDLNFITSIDNISIVWEVENHNYIDYSGHILMENIPDEGVMTNVSAELTYKGHTASITIPLYIIKVSTVSSVNDEIQSILNEENSPDDTSVNLPSNVSGHNIVYYSKKENFSFPFYLAG